VEELKRVQRALDEKELNVLVKVVEQVGPAGEVS
jgi:hypothetical protein